MTVRLPEAAPNSEMVAVAPEAPIVNEITMLNSWSLWKLPKGGRAVVDAHRVVGQKVEVQKAEE